jgi:hypothetical protein
VARFLTELDIRLIEDDKIWELDSPLVYKSNYLDSPIVVPKDFQTDLASIPRIPIIYELYGNRAHREGVIHDYLYRINSRPVVDRNTADWILYEAMVARKKPLYVRYPILWGVWIGGGSSFHRHRVEDKLWQK